MKTLELNRMGLEEMSESELQDIDGGGLWTILCGITGAVVGFLVGGFGGAVVGALGGLFLGALIDDYHGNPSTRLEFHFGTH
jgi:hypothetical protein